MNNYLCPLVALRAVCNPDGPTLSELKDWAAAFGMTPIEFSCMYSDRSISRMWQLMGIQKNREMPVDTTVLW
jgi:hypothetical protein